MINLQLKTANIILVYKNTSIQDYENISSVNSCFFKTLARLAVALQGFALSLGRLRLRECSLKREVVLNICEVRK